MEGNQSVNGYNSTLKMNQLGFVQWFKVNENNVVERTIEELKKLGVRSIKTYLSWAEWVQPSGKAWYQWLFERLARNFDVLPCIIDTPARLGIVPKFSSPPRDPQDFTNFIKEVLATCGKHFSYIEIWNEPNNLKAYDHSLDPGWNIFSQMFKSAAELCHAGGKKTVLGGMKEADPNWLNIMFSSGVIDHIDAVGMHGYPETSGADWQGWQKEISKLKLVLKEQNSQAEIWITEAGYSTRSNSERNQLKTFIEVLEAKADRVYWNNLQDDSSYPLTNGHSAETHKLNCGIRNADGSAKLLYSLIADKGFDGLAKYKWMTEPVIGNPSSEKYTLITGGSGFVGINLADRLLSEGRKVMIFDNLSRSGVYTNMLWLQEKYPNDLQVMIADVRDREAVNQAVANAEQVFHFAAQVAVTTSLTNPFHDFEVNAQGTLNILEAIRWSANKPPIVFTSTNKVYGDLHDLVMLMNDTRYFPENNYYRENGINEQRNLDFHSPYGCTKGVADQYILDYARTFGLQTVVFRMSCIYGPHQFGTEDQGWVAHFLIQSLKNKHITLYGDGKQVRDILFVEDLVEAFVLAQKHIDKISGHAFNMGGGPDNTVSLLELVDLIAEISGKKPMVLFDEWRPSDQKYYVSDFSKFNAATGWSPQHNTSEGVRKLFEWLQENAVQPARKQVKPTTGQPAIEATLLK